MVTCPTCGTSHTEAREECPSCLAAKAARGAPAVVKALFRERWITPALLGLLMGGSSAALVLFPPMGIQVEESGLKPLVIALSRGLCLAFPFASAALLVGLARRMWAVWVGYGLEVAMFMLFAIASLGTSILFTVIAIGVPIGSLMRVLKLARLVKQHPDARVASRGA